MAKADFRQIGPGIVVAATGLGAGDIVAASQAGARFGTILLWAVLVGGILKFVLNEGLARWQLVTGTTLLEGWIQRLPRFVSGYFAAYLCLWSYMVSAAMMAACGLAAFALWPVLSVAQWGAVHAVVAGILVVSGGYQLLETAMKVFVGLMFVSILLCAVLVAPSAGDILSGLVIPSLPDDSLAMVLGVMGGVGGSVTVMSYGYWMREAGFTGRDSMASMRLDLGVAYGLTALFGIAIIVVSAGVQPELAAGNNMALAVAERIENVLGAWGKWVFLAGFWGAVFTSMIGVWHGVPYLFADFVTTLRQKSTGADQAAAPSLTSTWLYRGYLAAMVILPMPLLILQRPVWVVVAYAVTGAFFMPLLAALLLYMNSWRHWLDDQRSGWLNKSALAGCLLLFGWLLLNELSSYF